MTAPPSTSQPKDTSSKLDLSLTQVIASALAAVTAAVLGSRISVAGTLIGAAGASIIVTVGTALYRASLEHSRDRIRSLAHRTRSLPIPRGETPRKETRSERGARFAMLRWGAVVMGTIGAFALAMMVITGFEWASGETVGGNGEGTTLGRVVRTPPGPQNRPEPSAPPSSDAPTSEAPTSTTPTSTTATTTAPSDLPPSVERSSSAPSVTSTPSVVPTRPPLIPPGLPAAAGTGTPETADHREAADLEDQPR